MGSDQVELWTTAGMLGEEVADHGTGVYSATLTSSTVAGEAMVTGTINSEEIGEPAEVHFVAGAPERLAIESGDDQGGTVGSELAQALVVRVEDAHGNPVPGQSVLWHATEGGGAVSPAQSTTCPEGLAATTATLGSSPGTNRYSATAEGTALSVTFTANATVAVGSPEAILMLGGHGQTGPPGYTLLPLTVKVVDAVGNPVPDVQVEWSAADDGSVLDSATTTGPDGTTSNTADLGVEYGWIYEYTAQVAGTDLSARFVAVTWPGDTEPPRSRTAEDEQELAPIDPAEGIATGFPTEEEQPLNGAFIWRVRYDLTVAIVVATTEWRYTIDGKLDANWGLFVQPYWPILPYFPEPPSGTPMGLPIRLAKEEANAPFSQFSPSDNPDCAWEEGACSVSLNAAYLDEYYPYGGPAHGFEHWPMQLYYDPVGERYLGTVQLSTWARPEESALMDLWPDDPNDSRYPHDELEFDWREGLDAFRDTSLPCVEIGGEPTIPIAVEIPAASMHSTEPQTIPLTNLTLHNRGCSGDRHGADTHIKVTGSIYLDPIFIAHPEHVEGGENRNEHSQFVYDAEDPGELRLEVSQEPPPEIRGYMMSAPEDDPVLTDFLNENILWTTPKLGDCVPGEVDMNWDAGDHWSEDPPPNPTDPYGKGLQANVTYTKLPSCNAGFGRKWAMAQVLDAEYSPSRDPEGAALFRSAGSVEYEVFYERCDRYADGECCARDSYGDCISSVLYTSNHPGPHNLRGGCGSVGASPGLKEPNWLYYWAQAITVDDGLPMSDFPYAYGDLVHDGRTLAEVPKMSSWHCWDGVVENVTFTPPFGVPGQAGRNPITLTVVEGINLFAMNARHERVHVKQVRCHNLCEEPSRPDPPIYRQVPLQDNTVRSGWSFSVRRGSYNLWQTLWNHWHPPEDNYFSLDANDDDQCNWGQYSFVRDEYECGIVFDDVRHEVRLFGVDRYCANNVCDADEKDHSWAIERIAWLHSELTEKNEEFNTVDWGAPGMQHATTNNDRD